MNVNKILEILIVCSLVGTWMCMVWLGKIPADGVVVLATYAVKKFLDKLELGGSNVQTPNVDVNAVVNTPISAGAGTDATKPATT